MWYFSKYPNAISANVSFVRIDPADWKLPGDNQRVSNSVFKVTRISKKDDLRTYVEPICGLVLYYKPV